MPTGFSERPSISPLLALQRPCSIVIIPQALNPHRLPPYAWGCRDSLILAMLVMQVLGRELT